MGIASGAIEKKLVSLSQSGDTLTWRGEANIMKSITTSADSDPEVSRCTSTHAHVRVHPPHTHTPKKCG